MLQAYPGLHYAIFSGNDLVVNMAPSDDWEINVGTNLRRPGGKTRVAVNQEERLQQMLAQGVNKLVVVDEAMTGVLEKNPPGDRPAASRPGSEQQLVQQPGDYGPGREQRCRCYGPGPALGHSMDQVMTLGDNENDIPMLTCAGVGVAVENATPGAACRGQVPYRVQRPLRRGGSNPTFCPGWRERMRACLRTLNGVLNRCIRWTLRDSSAWRSARKFPMFRIGRGRRRSVPQ